MKASIFGTGHVGATVAFSLVVKGTCDEIVLVNRTQRKAEGEAADLQHAAAFVKRVMSVSAGDIDATANADVIIICVSAPVSENGPGRSNLAEPNAVLFREWIEPLVQRSPKSIRRTFELMFSASTVRHSFPPSVWQPLVVLVSITIPPSLNYLNEPFRALTRFSKSRAIRTTL